MFADLIESPWVMFTTKKDNMKIVLIGAGRLALHLGCALHSAGHDIVQVYSRTDASARQVALAVGGTPVTDLGALSDDADVYVMAVKDSAMPELIPLACKGREQKVFVHTAGSLPLDVFRGMALHYAVLYPLQTFSKERDVDFVSVPCLLEANDAHAAAVVRTLATDVSHVVMDMDSENRRYVHLAAVFACNFTNHCYALAADMMERCGVPFDLLLPLIDETAAKVHGMKPADAQTGPAVRYDENVMRKHGRLLAGNPLAKEIYDRMSVSIHKKSIGG